MSTSELLHLWERYKSGTLSVEERRLWDKILTDGEPDNQLVEYWVQNLLAFDDKESAGENVLMEMNEEYNPQNTRSIDSLILVQKAVGVDKAKHPQKRIGRRLWWAAAIVIFLVAGSYLLTQNDANHPQQLADNEQVSPDVPPGKEGAILTLADGRKVVLDSVEQSDLAIKQGNSALLLQEGTLAYQVGESSAAMMYNTLTTPNGRQYKLVLPDGSVVWLNAASSIRYPVAFSSPVRKVELSGEAFFEVAKDKTKPFIVEINDVAAIEVLGTSFNVNSYTTDNIIKASLVNGSISVKSIGAAGNSRPMVIKPGQQAALEVNYSFTDKNNTTGTLLPIVIRDNIDMDQVLAWRNGFFQFDNMRLREVMNQLARWYDIEIVYEGAEPEIAFFGKMSRNISLGGLLRSLKASELNFRIEKGGKRLVVLS